MTTATTWFALACLCFLVSSSLSRGTRAETRLQSQKDGGPSNQKRVRHRTAAVVSASAKQEDDGTPPRVSLLQHKRTSSLVRLLAAAQEEPAAQPKMDSSTGAQQGTVTSISLDSEKKTMSALDSKRTTNNGKQSNVDNDDEGSSSAASSSGPKGAVESIHLDSEKQMISTIQEEKKGNDHVVDQKEAVGEQTNTSIYGQLNQVSEEFASIRKDDESHVHKLLFHVELRDKLRQRLKQEVNTITADDGLLANLVNTLKGENNKSISIGGSGGEPSLDLLALNLNLTTLADLPAEALGFLEKKTTDQQSANRTSEEELARSALGSLQALEQQITNLRSKDAEEVDALQRNAKNREKLKEVVRKQQEQLQQDANSLGSSLDQVRDLAVPPPVPPKEEETIISNAAPVTSAEPAAGLTPVAEAGEPESPGAGYETQTDMMSSSGEYES